VVAHRGGESRRGERPDRPQVGHPLSRRGEAGLIDRPSAAYSVHNRTPEDRIEAICALRRLRFTGAEIAEVLEMPETTVAGILTRVPSAASGAWASYLREFASGAGPDDELKRRFWS
jgi:hypothetical protein